MWKEVTRPRVIEEEFTYFDDKNSTWKVGQRTKQVHELVWVSRAVVENKEITKQVCVDQQCSMIFLPFTIKSLI